MKKIIAILFISFLSLQTTFAWLSVTQETKIKTQVEKAYLSFEKKLSKIENEAQIKKINTVTWKIDVLLKKKLSDKNRLVLTHLNDLLKARKVVLESEKKSTINSNTNNTEIKNTTQTSTNAQVSENLPKDTSSPEVYTERWSVWWVDTKAQQTYDQTQVDAIKSSKLEMQLYSNLSWLDLTTVSKERKWDIIGAYNTLSKWMQKWFNDEIITREYIDGNGVNSVRLRQLEKIYWNLSWKTTYELDVILYNQYLWYFKDWKLLDEKEFEKANNFTKSSFPLITSSIRASAWYLYLWYYVENWKVLFDASKVAPELQALKYIDLK